MGVLGWIASFVVGVAIYVYFMGLSTLNTVAAVLTGFAAVGIFVSVKNPDIINPLLVIVGAGMFFVTTWVNYTYGLGPDAGISGVLITFAIGYLSGIITGQFQ